MVCLNSGIFLHNFTVQKKKGTKAFFLLDYTKDNKYIQQFNNTDCHSCRSVVYKRVHIGSAEGCSPIDTLLCTSLCSHNTVRGEGNYSLLRGC